MRIDRTSRRIIGSLIEKRWTTPEQYPLTLNALVAACNQKSNRDPETQLEEFIVEGALYQLRLEGLVSVVERDTGRAVRYSERLEEKLGLSRQQQAIVAELMLRGPQTAGELSRRCERMAHFENEGEVENLLRGMADRGWTKLLPREPGQRHQRWKHLFAPDDEAPDVPAGVDLSSTQHIVETVARPAAIGAPPDLREEILALREELNELRARVARLERGEGTGDRVPTP
jgi:uncharacterized protein YceH (UPF0502 family)